MKLGSIGFMLGVVMVTMAAFMLVPASVGALSPRNDWPPFLTAAGLTGGVGMALLLACRGTHLVIYSRDAFLITTAVWIAAAFSGALPIALHEHATLTDAIFESMSGITTTGSTVFSHLDSMSAALLLWRSMLQWIGGLGFTLMAIAVLPLVGVGGMRLFRSESSDWSDKALPHTRDIAKSVGYLYVGLSVVCGAAYWLAGMSPFDAINHAMTTLSTGGYSTSDSSFGKYQSPLLQWLAIIFMIAGSLPFIAYFRALKHGPSVLAQDEQIRTFFWIMLAVILGGTLLLIHDEPQSAGSALTRVAFNVVSIITTTGYATEDYLNWGPFFVVLFFFLMFIGGCSGSTAGGLKVFRVQIAFRLLGVQIAKLVHPHGVIVPKLGGRRVDDDVLAAFVAFTFAVGITIIMVTLALAAMGIDLVTALSGAATAVTNVGPGVGPQIGPAGNFSTMPDMAKWLLSIAMLLGRLELLTVFVLFSASYWRA